MLQNYQNDIANTLAISRIAILLFSRTNSLTQSTLIFFLVDGWPNVQQLSHHTWTQHSHKNLSLSHCLLPNIPKAPVPSFPTLKQTLTQTSSFCRCTKITNGTTHTCTEHAIADSVYIQQTAPTYSRRRLCTADGACVQQAAPTYSRRCLRTAGSVYIEQTESTYSRLCLHTVDCVYIQ